MTGQGWVQGKEQGKANTQGQGQRQWKGQGKGRDEGRATGRAQAGKGKETKGRGRRPMGYPYLPEFQARHCGPHMQRRQCLGH